MKILTNLFFALIITSSFIACDKECGEEVFDCTFEYDENDMDGVIDDVERSIMDDCMEVAFSSKNKIKENLIGEWKLIGHGQGWFANGTQPCAYLNISKDKAIYQFQNQHIDTIFSADWDIEEDNNRFSFTLDSDFYEGLYINQFCEDYMFGDGTPFDGNMYLYEKVK